MECTISWEGRRGRREWEPSWVRREGVGWGGMGGYGGASRGDKRGERVGHIIQTSFPNQVPSHLSKHLSLGHEVRPKKLRLGSRVDRRFNVAGTDGLELEKHRLVGRHADPATLVD